MCRESDQRGGHRWDIEKTFVLICPHTFSQRLRFLPRWQIILLTQTKMLFRFFFFSKKEGISEAAKLRKMVRVRFSVILRLDNFMSHSYQFSGLHVLERNKMSNIP